MKSVAKSFGLCVAISAFLMMPRLLHAEASVESNVIYGMHSGLALLMDVHYPANPNGYGVVLISGSAWKAPLSYDARALKKSESMRTVLGADSLLERGYTLFSINHRAAPTFRHPAPVKDAQRAVRFIRHHAARYGIDPNRIGAVGHSSGAHLVSMVGVLNEGENAPDPSPVDKQSSRVQAVVGISTPADHVAYIRGGGPLPNPSMGMGLTKWQIESGSYALETAIYQEASPISHVSPDDPPFLLVHGDKDAAVPFNQSELFKEKLAAAGVDVELIRVPGGTHSLTNVAGLMTYDYFETMVKWFDRHLLNTR